MLERLIACVGVIAVASPLLGDVVVLRTGQIHEGQVRSFDKDELVLVIESGKTILERKRLASIHFGITAQEYTRLQAKRATPGPAATPAGELVEMGEPFVTPDFTLTVVGAKIARPTVRDMFGDLKQAVTPDLVITLEVANTDDRKILRFREENMFLTGHFSLRDDVDNAIRGVNYGMGSTPVGALTGSEDIQPGAVATHLELFSVPPPKTEFLVLTVKLQAFGGEGDVKYRIPSASIVGFSPR